LGLFSGLRDRIPAPSLDRGNRGSTTSGTSNQLGQLPRGERAGSIEDLGHLGENDAVPWRVCALVLGSLLAVGCGGSPAMPTDTQYQGSWAGQTVQSKTISFSVNGSAISSVAFNYAASAPCNLEGGFVTGSTTSTVLGSISKGAFSINFTGGPTTWTLTGSFSSGTAASGTLTVNLNNPGSTNCSTTVQTTWTATKGS